MKPDNTLSAEALAKPYYEFYLEPAAEPNPKLIAQLDQGPMDPSKALAPESIARLLEAGYHEVETGYCAMPNGTGYVAVNNVFPGVTVEMIKWWFAWHALEDLRYMLWFPKGHHGIQVSEADRALITDPNIGLEEKIYGKTHWVAEDTGCGIEDIQINFMAPEAFGLKLAGTPVEALIAGNGLSTSRTTGIKAPAVMCHTVRAIEGGVEFRSRFWMGYHFKDGKPVKLLPEGIQIPIQVMRGLAYHNVEEYSRLAAILPRLYTAYGQTF